MPTDAFQRIWSCVACKKGHRSDKCQHFERFMIRIKSPGRPLKTCPHDGHCDCLEKLMYVMLEVPSLDGNNCTFAPGVDPRPIPKDILAILNKSGTKTKGQQSKKGNALVKKPDLKMKHGYSFQNLEPLDHGHLAYQTAFQQVMHTSGVDALVGSNQGFAAPHLLTPEHSPANPPAITLNFPSSEDGYSRFFNVNMHHHT